MLTGIDPTWLVGGAQRRISLAAMDRVEIIWQCQPPGVRDAIGQNYPFRVEIIDRDLPDAAREGTIEILPVGFVELTLDPQRQQLPKGGKWLPDWKSKSAIANVSFKNDSNLYQQVEVQLQGKDADKCTYNCSPPAANLTLGATTNIELEIASNRPWLGIGKTLFLEAKGILSDRRLGSTDPATQSLEVRVLPRIPLWLQLAAIALLASIIGWLLKSGTPGHTDVVNSVRFSGDGDTAVSGSNDGTIRRWEVNGDRLDPHRRLAGGILASPNRATNSLRFMPEDSNRVAAGLENGIVTVLDVTTAAKIYDLEDANAQSDDRVFDLVFTQDSRNLFIGHGSGKVRVWNIPPRGSQNPPSIGNLIDLHQLGQSGFQVYTLAVSPDSQTLAIGGNFKRFILWDDWDKKSAQDRSPTIAVQKLEKLDPKLSAGTSDYVWGLAFAPKAPKVLATGDSDGYITIWNLSQCQPEKPPLPATGIRELNCQERGKIDRWQAGQQAIRTIAFNEDGKLLASAGDDGNIIVWSLTPEYKHDPLTQVNVDRSDRKINSIDLKTTNKGIEIISGGQDSHVQLHRMK
jgi:WD40 repeat protein